MYTYEEYTEYVKGFSSNHARYLLGDIIKDYYEETGKTPLDYDYEDGVAMLISSKLPLSESGISNYIGALKAFNKYMVEKGFKSSRYTDNASFNMRYIASHKEATYPYLTPQDVDNLINRQEIEKEWNTAFILTFYEGVCMRAADSYDLKEDMLDYNHNTITVDGRTIPIPKRLMEAYKYTSRMSVIQAPAKTGIQNRAIKSPPRSLLPSSADDKIKYASFCKRRFHLLSGDGTYISNRVLYYSGLLNYIIERSSPEECVEMFSERRSTADKVELFKAAGERYGLKRSDQSKFYLSTFILSMRKYYDI